VKARFGLIAGSDNSQAWGLATCLLQHRPNGSSWSGLGHWVSSLWRLPSSKRSISIHLSNRLRVISWLLQSWNCRVVESLLGLACLLTFRPRIALWGVIALLTLFLAATLFRWTLLQDTNCNCFGPLVTGGPLAVVFHTSVLISLAALLIALMRKATMSSSRRGLRVVSGVFATFLLIFAVNHASYSAISSPAALAQDQTRIFLSATCQKCQKDANKVRDLANSTDVPPVRVFIGASYESEIDDYLKKGNLQVKYTPLTFSQLSRETQHVPKVQIFRAGKLVKEWDGDVPGVDEVKRALLTGTEGVGNPPPTSGHPPAGD